MMMALINFKLTAILIVFSFTCQAVLGICDPKSCKDPTICTLSGDHMSCKCRTGLYNDLCDKDAKITVLCTKDFITLSVAEGYFQYYNTPIDTLHLPNKSCGVEREVSHGEAFYVARIPKDQYTACGGKKLEKNVTHITYALSLSSEPQVHRNIIRDPIIQIDYKCIYPYVRTVSLPFPVVPYVSEVLMRVDDLDATVQMMLYTDDTYSEGYVTAPTIELLDRVYVEVKVTEPLDFFNLRLDDCWATQSADPNTTDSLSHMLLEDGCVIAEDDTVSFVSLNGTSDPGSDQTQINGRDGVVRYSFQMFRFRTEPHQLYLHCSVQICERDQEHEADCIPSCSAKSSITKREAVAPSLNQGLLSYGPIRIDMPQPAESLSVMKMAALPVAGIWAVGLVLVLLVAVAKAGNRRLMKSRGNR